MDEKEWKRKIQESVDAYRKIYSDYEPEIPKKGLLAGFHTSEFRKAVDRGPLGGIVYRYDNLHYPLGNAFLHYGISGIVELTRKESTEDTAETAAYRQGVCEVYQEVKRFIALHADKAQQLSKETEDAEEKKRLLRIAENCRQLTVRAPQNFLEALQLFWFLYLFRSPFGSGCIGRLDQKLYPCCRAELEGDNWNEEEAIEGIMQFYGKLNRMETGDTLRNLMLSGQNAAGEDETNKLTYLFLEAYERTQDAEPHLNVRIHEKTPCRLKQLCIRMLAKGKGQPTLYFDRNLLPAMERAGIPREIACAYANDGCTETVYEGKSGITFWQHEMVKTVELTMFNGKENPCVVPVKMKKSRQASEEFEPHTALKLGYCSGELSKMERFSDFLDAFFSQLEFQISHWFDIIERKIEEDETDSLTSPLVGGTLEKCVLTGREPLRGGGFDVENYQLLSGTVTTAADCLRAVEYCVFEKHYCTLEELRDAMAADFEGYELLRRRLLGAPKYGNGDARADGLAALISERYLKQVNAYRSRNGKRIRPGLYNIDFKIFANLTGATPDGRKFRDAIGEHCSPTPGAAKCGPTAVIESASRLPMQEGYASSVLQSTLDGSCFVMGAQREKIIERLWDGAQEAGIPVWNLTMYSRQELLNAQKDPASYQGLVVRVWGFNARFVELDEELQNHIINRIS